MDFKIYVITLHDIKKYINTEHYNSIKKITNYISLCHGVIPSNNISNKFKYIPKSALGITLAHLKIWKYIKKYQNNNFSLILEDDTILNVNRNKFNTIIKNIINNNEFHIYKLHSDFNNGFTSMAAYIIDNSKMNDIIKSHQIMLGQIDFDIYLAKIFKNIKILTHNFNVFKTNEETSTNRIDKYNLLNKCHIYISKRSDKSLTDICNYKILRLFKYDIIVFDVVFLILFSIAILCKKRYMFLIIIILFLI
tara:strand:+ start:1824 stop:2576 length:753 start_codon:yes stop_codon:yes gene_type:complete